MKRSNRSTLITRTGASPAADTIVLGHSLPYFETGSEADASPVSTHYRESWRRFFATLFAALLLIGTEEGARAAFDHPAAAGSGHHASRNSHRLHEKPKCKTCGTIVSRREIDNGGTAPGEATTRADGQIQLATFYQFTLRQADGSLRVITSTNADAWREGERVSVIEGVKLASR
jgi:hypothetical protein